MVCLRLCLSSGGSQCVIIITTTTTILIITNITIMITKNLTNFYSTNSVRGASVQLRKSCLFMLAWS